MFIVYILKIFNLFLEIHSLKSLYYVSSSFPHCIDTCASCTYFSLQTKPKHRIVESLVIVAMLKFGKSVSGNCFDKNYFRDDSAQM